MRFRDRQHAGKELADKLSKFNEVEGVVYALPRGGAELGIEVSEKLQWPLDLLIPRKVGHPSHPEFAVCAVTEDGHKFCNDEAVAGLDKNWLDKAIESEKQEAKRRRNEYLSGREPIPVKGKTAIIVDDGIATGLTMLAAIAQVKDRNPARVIVAIPIVPPDTAEMLKQYADNLIAVEVPADYAGAVGAYYFNFDQVEDHEVKELLEKTIVR